MGDGNTFIVPESEEDGDTPTERLGKTPPNSPNGSAERAFSASALADPAELTIRGEMP